MEGRAEKHSGRHFKINCWRHSLHRKPFFFQTSWKDGLSKKNRAGIWSFLYYRERSCFFFPKIWSYTLGGKWKMIFPKKNTRKYDIFFKLSEKMVFSKGATPRDDLSCIIWKNGIFFPENTIFFPWAGSERWPISRKTWKYDIFRVHVRVLQTQCHAPLSKKNQRWSYLAKKHLKVIDVLDWHPRKSSRNSLYFHGDLYKRFHVLLSGEKTQET